VRKNSRQWQEEWQELRKTLIESRMQRFYFLPGGRRMAETFIRVKGDIVWKIVKR
jgi:hypothetical protein